jgi:PRC-barrel domain
MMNHANHTRLMDSELSTASLMDATVYGIDNEKLGKVSHVHGMGSTATVIVDVGGFLGIGAKPVALTCNQLSFMRDENGDVHATSTMTKDQIKALPEHHH